MKKLMKKLISSLLLLIMLFSLAACGNEAAQPDNPNTSTEQNTPVQSQDDGSSYYGSWEAVSYEEDGVTATSDALENSGNYTLKHTGLILRDDGKYYFYTPFDDEIAEWKVTSDGINVDGDDIKFSNNKLALILDTNQVCYFEKVSADTTFPEDRNVGNEYFYGTWSVIGGYINSSESALTLAEIKSSYEEYAESKVIFSNDGKIFIRLGNETINKEWTYADNKVQVDNSEVIALKDNLIYVPFENGDMLIFEKVSDDQTIPETSSETGLRTEFKEAMDAYEAFYDEYCEILQKYKENPTDMSILTEYMELMGKLADMDAKFKAWESEDLNTEELKYYLEVSNRIMQKMLEAAA